LLTIWDRESILVNSELHFTLLKNYSVDTLFIGYIKSIKLIRE
jgi:hypothetical protein